jgi:glycosyltransferase involved in cell wall biosynthesis
VRVAIASASPIWGGAERMALTLGEGLAARGHEVVMLVRPGGELEERLPDGVERAPVLRGFDLNPPALWRSALALRRHRARVLLTTTDKELRLCGPAARLLGIPLIHRQATDRPVGPGWRHRLFQGRIPSWWIVNSAATRATYLASAPWIPEARVSTIPNGIDPAPFAAALPVELGLPPGATAIGYVGRLDRRKGLLDLAAAWPAVAAQIPEAYLVLVGSGELEGELRAALAGAERVRWLGSVRDTAPVYRALDMVVMPSHREGFGLVAVEAMAAGTPVIAARSSSLPEVVGDAALLAEAHDPGGLAASIVRLARDAELRARLIHAGAARVRGHFSLEVMMERYEEVLLRVAEEHG